MKIRIIASLTALAVATAAAPALAQPASPAPAPASDGGGASAALSVQTTKIGDLVKNPAAKAALEKALPEIPQYYDQISDMTLAEVAPMSQGAVDDAKLKEIQAELDKIQ